MAISIYKDQYPSYFVRVVRSIVSCYGPYLTIAHALLHTVSAGAYWHKINSIYACAFPELMKLCIISRGAIKFCCVVFIFFESQDF